MKEDYTVPEAILALSMEYGGYRKLAEEITAEKGVTISHQAVHDWAQQRSIPSPQWVRTLCVLGQRAGLMWITPHLFLPPEHAKLIPKIKKSELS